MYGVRCLVHNPSHLKYLYYYDNISGNGASTAISEDPGHFYLTFMISELCHESETLESQLILCFTHRTQIRKLNECSKPNMRGIIRMHRLIVRRAYSHRCFCFSACFVHARFEKK